MSRNDVIIHDFLLLYFEVSIWDRVSRVFAYSKVQLIQDLSVRIAYYVRLFIDHHVLTFGLG
jgi:hypothetical protein